jgi:hypothetical protein
MLYPEIEPYEHGLFDVGYANLVYWEVCGHPKGKPVVVLHGVPVQAGTQGFDATSIPEFTKSLFSTSGDVAGAYLQPVIFALTSPSIRPNTCF